MTPAEAMNEIKKIILVPVEYQDIIGNYYFKCYITAALFARYTGGKLEKADYDFYKYVVVKE